MLWPDIEDNYERALRHAREVEERFELLSEREIQTHLALAQIYAILA